jgi:hypothetical protein
MAFAKWVTVPGNASQKNWRYTIIRTIISASQKKQSAQYFAFDCFASMFLIFGKDKGAERFLNSSTPGLLNIC